MVILVEANKLQASARPSLADFHKLLSGDLLTEAIIQFQIP